MKNFLSIGEAKNIVIDSKEEFSGESVEVKKGEQYEITADKAQVWYDLKFKSGPDGFFNLFAWLCGLRVKKTKCFCLCGAYNNDDRTGFAIGSFRIVHVTQNGYLSFFANDTRGYYYNNKGSIGISIKRLI